VSIADFVDDGLDRLYKLWDLDLIGWERERESALCSMMKRIHSRKTLMTTSLLLRSIYYN